MDGPGDGDLGHSCFGLEPKEWDTVGWDEMRGGMGGDGMDGMDDRKLGQLAWKTGEGSGR